jgi:hypothetical protein
MAHSRHNRPEAEHMGKRKVTQRHKRGEKVCFVMMPFTEPDDYPSEHFKRVYRYIIQPACEQAGYKPVRVDDINTSNHIVIEIIRNIVEAEMAICDLSSQSPNVLYELGVRHAFNKPVTLIKDIRTSRMFDIQGLRDIEYDESLRADTIEKVIPVIADSLRNNHDAYENGSPASNSVIQLLGIESAKLPEPVEISYESGLILDMLSELRGRLTRIEQSTSAARPSVNPGTVDGPSASERLRSERLDNTEAAPAHFVQHREYGIGLVRKKEGDGRMMVDFVNEGMKLVEPGELTTISLAQSGT